MRCFTFDGGDVYVAYTSCGCNPEDSHRPHQCTNASTGWVRCVPRATERFTDWLRVRSGAGVVVASLHLAGATYDEVQTALTDFL